MVAQGPLVLIFGAGPNVGQSDARTFASNGYKVGLAARFLKEADSTDSQLHITWDISKTDDVVNAFTKIKETFRKPSVVVYNGTSHKQSSSQDFNNLPSATAAQANDIMANITLTDQACQQRKDRASKHQGAQYSGGCWGR